MEFLRRYSIPIGLFVLACVVVLLLATPGTFFSREVSFIDSQLNRSSGRETSVKATMDFGDTEHMAALPTQIDEWRGTDLDASEIQDKLGADLVFMRAYACPGLYQPLILVIVQAQTETSFHPPPICYQSQGWKIQEQGEETLDVVSAGWSEDSQSVPVPVNKMVVVKEADGVITERRVVLYYYVKGNQFTSGSVTMVEASGLAPVEGTYDGILGLDKEFAAATVPLMFEPVEGGGGRTLAARLTEYGALGDIAIGLLVMIPLSIMIVPQVARRTGSVRASRSGS